MCGKEKLKDAHTFISLTDPDIIAATSVTGNVKDILATFVGAFAFNDFTPTAYSVSGIAVSFVGAAAFSWAKLAEMRPAKPPPVAVEMTADTEATGGKADAVSSSAALANA